jgi:Zn-dependent peptidase ImmA (M78 family)/DNA-binding XRE family transcriptional regulator
MINGDRIRQAREIAGLTQSQLADALGVTQAHVALFEQNLRQPQDSTLQSIAFATKFPVAFFRREASPDFPLGSLLYRRRKSMGSKDRERVRQSGKLIFEAIMHMADRFKKIDLRLPRLTGVDPEEAARITRTDLGFSPDTPIVHLMSRLEKNGVVIAVIPYEIEEYDAFSVWADTDPKTPAIVLSNGKPGDRQRWNVAHELAHLVLHFSYTGSPSDLDHQADRFAGEFLLPEQAVREILEARPLTLTALAELKSQWGVSMQAWIMRAFQLGIITDGQRRYLFRQMAAKEWLRNEPVPIPPEHPRLLRRLAEELYGQTFDVRRIAELVDGPAHMFRSIVDSYASASDLRGAPVIKKRALAVSGGGLVTMRRRVESSEG